MGRPNLPNKLEDFLAKIEAKVIAFLCQFFGQLRRTTIEYGYLPFIFVENFLKNFIPIRSASVGASFQSRHQVPFFLQSQRTITQCQRKLSWSKNK